MCGLLESDGTVFINPAIYIYIYISQVSKTLVRVASVLIELLRKKVQREQIENGMGRGWEKEETLARKRRDPFHLSPPPPPSLLFFALGPTFSTISRGDTNLHLFFN